MMEAASTFETSVNFCGTMRRNNPEDSHIHTRRRENLRSHLVLSLLIDMLTLKTLKIKKDVIIGFSGIVSGRNNVCEEKRKVMK
jgi:hypothetical protein